MNTIKMTLQFKEWLSGLNDPQAAANVARRITRARKGNFGDSEPAGEGVSEMRIHYGPGYRVYYAREEDTVYLLLVGGDKSSQRRDIKRAIAMWRELKGG